MFFILIIIFYCKNTRIYFKLAHNTRLAPIKCIEKSTRVAHNIAYRVATACWGCIEKSTQLDHTKLIEWQQLAGVVSREANR